MKLTMLARWSLSTMVVLALATGGCRKDAPVEPPAAVDEVQKLQASAKTTEEPAETPTDRQEPRKEPRAEEEQGQKAEPTAGAAAGSPEENCGAVYDFTKQMMEAFAQKFGAKSKAAKELPPREKFIEACIQLPPEVSRCMNPQVAMSESEKCQEIMQKVDQAQLEKFKSLMK